MALPSYERELLRPDRPPGELLVHGLRGHVYRSTDGGANWTQLASKLPISISAAVQDAGGMSASSPRPATCRG